MKPEKYFPKSEKRTCNRKSKPEKVFRKAENCYFNRKPTFVKPENDACNRQITPALNQTKTGKQRFRNPKYV